mmetsp:Transcript_21186/g.61852  ORF Transcript_21186/g.61852 Transcript_21186/m.61852 type:complete len:289 (-) Transcript_21186:1670-2536(-)
MHWWSCGRRVLSHGRGLKRNRISARRPWPWERGHACSMRRYARGGRARGECGRGHLKLLGKTLGKRGIQVFLALFAFCGVLLLEELLPHHLLGIDVALDRIHDLLEACQQVAVEVTSVRQLTVEVAELGHHCVHALDDLLALERRLVRIAGLGKFMVFRHHLGNLAFLLFPRLLERREACRRQHLRAYIFQHREELLAGRGSADACAIALGWSRERQPLGGEVRKVLVGQVGSSECRAAQGRSGGVPLLDQSRQVNKCLGEGPGVNPGGLGAGGCCWHELVKLVPGLG